MNRQILVTMFDLINYDLFEVGEFDDAKRQYVSENIKPVYKLSKYHDVSHIIADAVEKLKIVISDEELAKKIKKQIFVPVVRYERLEYELLRVCDALEKHEIYHIPLKGAVLRKHYSNPWLRTSCDIDILIHKENLESALKLLEDKLDYKVDHKSAHDVSLFSEGGVNLELHYELVEDGRVKSVNEVLQRVWDYTTVRRGTRYRLEMTDEMFYFYHIAHMAKHFEIGGCGIKPFIDSIIMKKSGQYRMGEENSLLKEAGLLKFEGTVNQLCSVWFEGNNHNSVTEKMQEFLISGGTYGSTKNKTAVQAVKQGGKGKLLWHLIWMPYDNLKYRYPVLEKKKWLFPFCQIRRWCGLIFKLKSTMGLIKTIKNKSSDEIDNVDAFLNDIGLEFK